MFFGGKLHPDFNLVLFLYLHFISFTSKNKRKIECRMVQLHKLKWTDETTEMMTELMHITFCNSQWFLVETGTISSNYSRLSICQMFLLLETLLWLFSKFPYYLYQRKRKMNVTFPNSGWGLSLERSYLSSISSLLTVIQRFKNSIHYGG